MSLGMAEFVEIFEVGPRDGLQNEARTVTVAQKIALVECLNRADFRRIEVASFVSPKWVPQMADSADVLAGIERVPGVSYAALTPNLKGLERAVAADADEVAVFGSASEGFSKANINKSIAESFDAFSEVVYEARDAGLPVRGYASCVVECPYDGPTPPEKAAEIAAALFGMGCYEISLGDTTGRSTPEAVAAMLEAVAAHVPASRLAGHFHDTSGRALDNIDVSLDAGLRVFDAAVGGLGGCPYAPGAAGNVATEKVAARLKALGYETGLDQDAINKAAEMAHRIRGGHV